MNVPQSPNPQPSSGKKVRRKLTISLLATALVSFCLFFGWDYATDRVLQLMLSSAVDTTIDLPAEENTDTGQPTEESVTAPTAKPQSPDTGSEPSEVAPSQPASEGGTTSSNEPVTHDPTNQETKSSTPASDSDTKVAKEPPESTDPPAPSEGASTAASPTEETDGEEDFTYTPDISAQKAAKVQENITVSEKATLTRILMANLSMSDLRIFAAMARDGITVEEKKAVKETFLKNLSEEDYNTLIHIAAKYGLSQGRTYEESLESLQTD